MISDRHLTHFWRKRIYMPDLNGFNVDLKKWRPADCACRICKVYIANVGFI